MSVHMIDIKRHNHRSMFKKTANIFNFTELLAFTVRPEDTRTSNTIVAAAAS